MSPTARYDRRDGRRLIDETGPSEAAMIKYVGVGFEDQVRQPVIAHESPDVFDWMEL